MNSSREILAKNLAIDIELHSPLAKKLFIEVDEHFVEAKWNVCTSS